MEQTLAGFVSAEMRRIAALLLAPLGLIAFGGVGHAQIRAHYGDVANTYTMERVADDVYAVLTPDSKTPFVSGNSMVVFGRDAILVVDSGHVPSVAHRVIADIKRITDRPVRFVVNTHWHFDHLVGNGEYRRAFPDVAIVSTPPTLEQVEAQLPGYSDTLAKRVPAMIDGLRKALQEGKKADGTPLAPDDREFYDAEVRDFTAAIRSIAGMTYAPPTVTFDRELTVDLGGRVVRILFLGRGNTAGDAVVYVPDAKVVATGDLLVAPAPYATGSFMLEWPDAMRKLMALDAATIVPGHGPLLHDWTYAARVTALLESVNAQVKSAVDRGLTLDETKQHVDVATARTAFCGDDPFQRRIFDTYFLTGAIERSYKETIFLVEK